MPTETGAHTASYTMGTVLFPGVKRTGRGVNHPPPSSVEVRERVNLYSPSVLSWQVIGLVLPERVRKNSDKIETKAMQFIVTHY